jgi:hypothetical protein
VIDAMLNMNHDNARGAGYRDDPYYDFRTDRISR